LDGNNGKNTGFFTFKNGPAELAAFWKDHGERVVAQHVNDFPGTRPIRWWEYDAPRSPLGTYPSCFCDGKLPEPRKRLGGIGTPNYQALAISPSFTRGIPDSWVTPADVAYYTGASRDTHGKLTNQNPSSSFDGVAIDTDDPPRFESEAAYLERHGLLFPDERQRISDTNFEHETVVDG
jgi:hypothetical protein